MIVFALPQPARDSALVDDVCESVICVHSTNRTDDGAEWV